MLAAQERRLQAYQRAQAFVKAHSEVLAGTSSAREARLRRFAALDDHIARVQLAAVQQEAGARASQAATRRLRAAVRHLRIHYLNRLSAIASGIREEVVGLDMALFLPRNKTPVTQLVSQADAMLLVAKEHEDLLVRWGMEKDFVAGMRRAIDAVSHEVQQRDLARQQQVGATAALDPLLEETRLHLNTLDGFVTEAWKEGSSKHAEWRSARSVHKPRRATKKVVDEGVKAVGAPPPQLLLPAGSTLPLMIEATLPEPEQVRRAPE